MLKASFSNFLKRSIDMVVAGSILLLASPVLLLIAWQVRRHLGRPVLFRQTRPGLQGRPFVMTKFRTMAHALNAQGHPLPDAQRITPFGDKLRASSLDELPALWQVLTGKMSLVGPRPLLMEYLPLYSPEQARRHQIKPGITGWAQVNGRNAISWEEKFKYDLWYLDNRTTWLDTKILWLTLHKVWSREGVNATHQTPMPKFAGTSPNTHHHHHNSHQEDSYEKTRDIRR